MSPFEANVRIRGGVAIVDLRGQLDGKADDALDGAYEAAIKGDPAAVLLNFEEVTYINSTGIALIVGVLARARKHELAMLVCGLSDHYQHIFEITRLADFMQFFPDEEAAVVGATPVV
ncbi:MAG: STAS domain-containing protein [Nitriliruptorales bacterium]|nr:STAS domain-containing protein [Nitriliruptorales bacterium]